MVINGQKDIREPVEELARAIVPAGTCGNHDAAGGYVTSLTEAVMGITAGLHAIADAIQEHNEILRERNQS